MRSTTDAAPDTSERGRGGEVDLVARLTALADTWLDVDPDALPVETTGDLLVGLEQQIGRLKAAALAFTASIDRREGYRATGHNSVQHLLQDVLRQTAGAAKAQADTARTLDRGLDETTKAVREGEISPDHAVAIARAAEKLDDDPHAEATLLAAARSGDPNRVRRTGDRLSQRADAEAARRKARRSYEQRVASFRHGPDGSVFFEGRLHQLGGEKLLTAIDALCAPAGRDDDRSPGQRRADALVSLADIAMGDRRLPADGREPPQLTVLVPLATIERRAGATPGTLAWTGPCPPQVLEELVCEAGLDWLITDPRGLPLHLGRHDRFANRAQRRALRARDGGCRWPGCDGRAEWSVAHHVETWDAGGPTDLHNLVSVCPAHHATIHHGGWNLTLDADATVTIRSPDGRTTRSETAAEARARHLHATGVDPGDSEDDQRGATVARERRVDYMVQRAPPRCSTASPRRTIERGRHPPGAGGQPGQPAPAVSFCGSSR